MSLLTDCELVKSYINGNNQALEVILERHQKSVYNYIYNKVQKQELAEDLFQDTFIKVILNLKEGKYFDDGKFISWVLRIAHNIIVDHYRSKKKLQLITETTFANEDFSIFDMISEKEISYEEQIIKEQVYSELKEIIHLLPEDQREIVDLRIFKDYSFKDVAEELNISINTCLGRMRYALINLRKHIDKNKILLNY